MHIYSTEKNTRSNDVVNDFFGFIYIFIYVRGYLLLLANIITINIVSYCLLSRLKIQRQLNKRYYIPWKYHFYVLFIIIKL